MTPTEWNPVTLEGYPKCQWGVFTDNYCNERASRYWFSREDHVFMFLCATHTSGDVQTLPIATIKDQATRDQDMFVGLKQAIARLREALDTYGVHLTLCMIYKRTAEDIARSRYPACTCGLAAALAEPEGA